MILTRLIEEHMKDGYGSNFVLLLEDWGRWARFFGCQGYKGGQAVAAPAFIDDESAALIDLAMGEIKRNKPQIWKLMQMRYIQGMDAYAISKVLGHGLGRRKVRAGVKKRAGSYLVIANEQGLADVVDEFVIVQLIGVGARLVYTWLSELQEGLNTDR